VKFEWQQGWPQTLCELELELVDGRRVSAHHDAGIRADNISQQGERLVAKFDALVAPVLGAPRAREVREMISGLDDVTDIRSLARLVTA